MAETAKQTTTKKTTTKNTAARKTAARKTAARKTAARKTAARKTSAEKTSAKKTAATSTEHSPFDAVTEQLKDVESQAERFMETASARLESAAGDVVKFARDVAHTYIGVGLVVQDRIVKRTGERAQHANFLEEARERGHAQVSELQARFEPLFDRVSERFDPIAERVEAQLPEQVREAIESGRDRVRKLVAA